MNSPIRHPLINAMQRHISRMFGGAYFDRAVKRSHYEDFGYPETLHHSDYYAMYRRNGLAAALVDRTIGKTWETMPWLMEYQPDTRPTQRDERTGRDVEIGETKLEASIRRRFAEIRFWQSIMEADRRSMVGDYAAIILRYKDGAAMHEPAGRVPGGIEGLHEVLPVWQGQLTVDTWVDDHSALDYGQPRMYSFYEANLPGSKPGQARSYQVHPSRVVIFSSDGTVFGAPSMQPSYNALLDLEKISGAGGEGFYKNAAQRLALEATGDDDFLERIAAQYDEDPNKAIEMINEQVADFKSGIDKMWIMQGAKMVPIQISLAQPKEFFEIALQTAVAPFGIPTKELVGNQTGERASTEDAIEFSKTMMSRRDNRVLPHINETIDRLREHGVLPARDWFVDWPSLIDATPDQKLDRAHKMATANQTNAIFGQVFTPSEIREEAGREPDMPDELQDDGFDENDAGENDDAPDT